ncbi:hypothetical protein BYT27DRAFT_7341177 [Phlegmacium glaucopus]|nr:hypothetical protein BYT27DRAFT_7341177 [Phlegmacium glaucopus]
MKSNPVFNAQSSGPIWKLAVKVWNEFADKQPGIFYKLVEQLKVHYSVWEVQVNVKQTLSMSLAIRNPLLKAARNPSQSMAAPTLPTRQLITHKPTKGFDTSSIPHQPFDPDQLVMTNVAQNPLVHLPTTTPMSVVDCGPEPPSSHLMDVDSATPFVLSSTPTAAPDAIIRTLVSHHMHADVARVQPAPKPVKKQK